MMEIVIIVIRTLGKLDTSGTAMGRAMARSLLSITIFVNSTLVFIFFPINI